MILIVESLFVGIVGNVFAVLLFAPGKIFDFWTIWINKITNNIKGELRGKIRLVTYGCESCISGQIGFWYMVYVQIDLGIFDLWFMFKFVVLSIFFGALIGKILK